MNAQPLQPLHRRVLVTDSYPRELNRMSSQSVTVIADRDVPHGPTVPDLPSWAKAA